MGFKVWGGFGFRCALLRVFKGLGITEFVEAAASSPKPVILGTKVGHPSCELQRSRGPRNLLLQDPRKSVELESQALHPKP